MALANKVIYQNGAIREFEKPEVCEAIKVANANRWTVSLSPIEWDERKARLKKEHEKHANASDKMGMTLKEAKKILEKEFAVISLHKSTEPFEFDESKWFKHEKPSVLEAFRVLSKGGYYISISGHDYNMREKRLKKEYEENTKDPNPAKNRIKGNFPGNKSIEYCGDSMPGPGEEQPKEGNPALKESATQFNDALLDEQAKKIEELTMENERLKDQVAVLYAYKEHNENFDRKQIKRLGKEITRLNKIIHKKNLKIDEIRKESSRHLRGKMKMFGENFDLEQELNDKNAVLSDVAEELRLSKIREKNLTEVCQKYMKENEELKKELADKVVDKIDAQALKSAESALAYKEKVIADLTKKLKSINMNRHNERIYKKQLAEKDEVIAELDKELDEANKHQQQAYRSCADKNKEIRALKLQISALEKRGNGIDWKRNADAIKLYVNRASHERLWSPISQDICNEQELSFIINHGGKRVKYALRFDGTDIVYECSDPDKKPSFFRDDSVGAVTNKKDCSPVKDTHSTEDNPEEIEIEKAVKLVRKAMKEGRTVTIDYKD